MSTAPAGPKLDSQALFNIPNQLTSLRLILSIILFVMIPLGYYLASTILHWISSLKQRKCPTSLSIN